MTENCGNCHFYRAGQCRISPPLVTSDGTTCWPEPHPEAWCAQFEASKTNIAQPKKTQDARRSAHVDLALDLLKEKLPKYIDSHGYEIKNAAFGGVKRVAKYDGFRSDWLDAIIDRTDKDEGDAEEVLNVALSFATKGNPKLCERNPRQNTIALPGFPF